MLKLDFKLARKVVAFVIVVFIFILTDKDHRQFREISMQYL